MLTCTVNESFCLNVYQKGNVYYFVNVEKGRVEKEKSGIK